VAGAAQLCVGRKTMTSPKKVEKTLLARFHKATGAPLRKSVEFLSQFSDEQQQKLTLIAETSNGQLHDPIEDEESIKSLFEAVKTEAESEAKQFQSRKGSSALTSKRGLCHLQWAIIKRLMLERHGISWRSPAELNPWITFD
jgi:hypothetical protein